MYIFGNLVLDAVFPKKCFHCHRLGYDFCPHCRSFLVFSEEDHCIICRNPSVKGFTHNYCKNKYSPERYFTCLDTNPFEKSLKRNLYCGKYTSLTPLFTIFADELESLRIAFGKESLVVPLKVKLGKSKRASSIQYNEIFARALVRETKTNLCADIWGQEYAFPFRTGSKPTFYVKRKKEKSLLGKDVILVSVFNNRSGFLEGSKALKRIGVRYIYCFSLFS